MLLKLDVHYEKSKILERSTSHRHIFVNKVRVCRHVVVPQKFSAGVSSILTTLSYEVCVVILGGC